MSTKPDGGSAFPEPGNAQCGGMTLRDYFAAAASDDDVLDVRHTYYMANVDKPDFMALTQAQARYMHADAMLAERAK